MTAVSSIAQPIPPVPVLVVKDVRKRFVGTQALSGIGMEIHAGEIHAFLGANGAGKSTLIRILGGVHKADSGEIRYKGKVIEPGALAARVSIVHQDLGLIDSMTVGENMVIGQDYPRQRIGLVDWRAVQRRAVDLLAGLGTVLPLDKPVSGLSQAERSIVAIARALSRDVDLLVLDEPTASLPEADVERLFAVLDRLRRRQVAIVYVTHRLDEVFRIADAATVIRDGRTVAVHRPLTISTDQLVSEIVGHVPHRAKKCKAMEAGPVVLSLNGACSNGCGPVELHVRRGEIIGLTGLRGQGQEATGRVIAGAQPLSRGEMQLAGKPVAFRDTAAAIRAGIGFGSGRRAAEGIARTLTVQENLFLNPLNFGAGPLSFRWPARETSDAVRILNRFRVKPADPSRSIATLSGGNQQKVVLARLAGQNYRLVVLEDPTIGVDIGVKAEIYRMMSEDARTGTTYIVVSSDFEELIEICDRVLAFDRGRIVDELMSERLTTEALTHAVSGAGPKIDGRGNEQDDNATRN